MNRDMDMCGHAAYPGVPSQAPHECLGAGAARALDAMCSSLRRVVRNRRGRPPPIPRHSQDQPANGLAASRFKRRVT